MGNIIDIQEIDEKTMKCNVEVNLDEWLQLQGSCKNVYLFSTTGFTHTAKVMETSIHNSTKYFEIPSELKMRRVGLRGRRRRQHSKRPTISNCVSFEIGTKQYFAYVIHKAHSEGSPNN